MFSNTSLVFISDIEVTDHRESSTSGTLFKK